MSAGAAVETTGECFCGALRYALTGPIEPAMRCHCSRCRKAFSGAGSAMSRVRDGQFRWLMGTDGLTVYAGEHGYGIGFCATCGSTLVGTKGGAVMGVTLGTLNGDPPVEVERHIFVGSKASWDLIGDSAPQHLEWPE